MLSDTGRRCDMADTEGEHEQRHHNAARKAEQYCRQEADGPGVSFQVSSCFLSAYCAGPRVR